MTRGIEGPLVSRPVVSRHGIFFWLFSTLVTVRFTFFLVMVLMAGLSGRSFSEILIWVFVAGFGVLLHEFGHVGAARYYRHRPRVELYTMGGVTTWENDGRAGSRERLVISLAGPAIGLVLFLVMWTWWSGRRRLAAARQGAEGTPGDVLDELTAHRDGLHRVPGTAVFLTEDKDVAPFALRTTVEVARVLPEHVVLLSWQVADTPNASAHETVVDVDTFADRYDGVLGVAVTLGYRERLDAEHVLSEACERSRRVMAGVDASTATYLVSEPIPQVARDGAMAAWRQRLFLAVDRLATDRVEQLRLPRDRTIVLGREFDL